MDKYYTVAELAEILKVNPKSVYRWIREKTIGVTRFGRREIRFSESQIKAFLQIRDIGPVKESIWDPKVK